ncbi:MAG: 2-dehydro-3-deoxy-6-phosphogalactonate aldolase, partial [Alphaproteobacteria bacterium]
MPRDWVEGLLAEMPLVAILRGLAPKDALAVGQALYDAGFRFIEVPLNSPRPLDSIERLATAMGRDCLVGAGTVLQASEVDAVREAGGRLIVSPNTDGAVIARAVACGMVAMPGFATASEAFAAVKAGARYLKLFPASSHGPGHVKALKAVLEPAVRILAVGGVTVESMAAWRQAGTDGFGIGGEL